MSGLGGKNLCLNYHIDVDNKYHTDDTFNLHPKENPMPKDFDASRPVQTRSGAPARIIAVDRQCGNGYSMVALVTHSGRESVAEYTSDGRALLGTDAPNDEDLVNVVVESSHFINLHQDGRTAGWWPSKRDADAVAGKRLACIQITSRNGNPVAVALV